MPPRARRLRSALPLGLLALAARSSFGGPEIWTGTVVTDAVIHEAGGDHPQKTRIRLRLFETSRKRVPGGDRIDLRSEGTSYEVENSMHGLVECSGKGQQTVSDSYALSALQVGQGSTTYHLVVTRALYSFNCGGQLVHGEGRHGRMVGIGTTPPIDLSVLGLGASPEVEDAKPRLLEVGGSVMRGAFTATRQVDTGPNKSLITYDYGVQWELCRGESYCGK